MWTSRSTSVGGIAVTGSRKNVDPDAAFATTTKTSMSNSMSERISATRGTSTLTRADTGSPYLTGRPSLLRRDPPLPAFFNYFLKLLDKIEDL